MATDPVKSIQERNEQSDLLVNTRDFAARLATIEPSVDIPIVTVTLDWRIEGTNPGRQPFYPEGTRPDEGKKRSSPDRPDEEREAESARRRPSRRIFEDRMDEIVESHGPHGNVFESLKDDFDRISHYLDSKVDPSARGVYIVSCASSDLFDAISLAMPLSTEVTLGPTPVLTELARLDEDFPAYAVLLADQREAKLSFITYGLTQRSVAVEGSGYPRKQAQGGWSQRRYQARADERIEAFARDVAEETRKELDAFGVETLIVAGDEVITSALDDEFHETVKDRIVATLHLDNDITEGDLIEATQPVAQQAERVREADAVRRMSDSVGAGTYGAGGASAVLTALQAGQVETLVMNDDFEGTGWADYTRRPANQPSARWRYIEPGASEPSG